MTSPPPSCSISRRCSPSLHTTLETHSFTTKAAWKRWLHAHHEEPEGLWLKLAKKDSGIKSVTRDEALEVALCYGWIDGQAKPVDEHYWLQKFTPRRPNSIWSKINCAKVQVLIENELMQPAGLAAIEKAKANGRWESAYAAPSTAVVPADLQLALDASPAAAAFFATLKGSNRYAILFRLQTAKKPETRAARLSKFLAMLERGETLH